MLNCQVEGCGEKRESLRSLKRHYSESHSGDLWPDESDLPDTESEQMDFFGDEPSTDGHDPEYEVTNDIPETSTKQLRDFGGEE